MWHLFATRALPYFTYATEKKEEEKMSVTPNRLAGLWRNRSLAIRFLLVYLLVSMITVATLTWRSGTVLTTALEEEYEHELELQALMVASALQVDVEDMSEGKRTPVQVLALMQRFASNTDSRITLFTPDLQVVFSTDPAVPSGGTHRYPEILAALDSREQHDIRVDPVTGDERLYVAAPIQEEEHVVGVVQLSIPWQRVHTRIMSEWTRLIMSGLLVIAANVLVSLWLAFGIVRPLRELTGAARDLSQGHLDRRIPVTSGDEVGRLAHAFNEMAQQLQEMIERQRMFIANASHELRGPLTSIKLRTEALLEDKNIPPERRRRFTKEVDQEVDRLRRLAERLLDLSRLQMRPNARAFQVVPFSQLLHENLDIIAPRAAKKEVSLVREVAQDLPPVYGDPEDLSELFLNLLDNAIKYTPPGGTVTLRAHTKDDHIVVEVSDTGEGIPVDALPHIFEPFYRVDKSRSRRIEGSGLGLAIVKAIVEAHKGQIDVRSVPGEGTTFYVILPRYRPGRKESVEE